MSASAAVGQVSPSPSDGAEAIEAARKARDALFSTKLSAILRKERDESAGIKARTTLATEFFVRQFKIRGGSGFGKGTVGGRPGKNDKLLSNRVLELAKQYGVDQSEFKNFSPFDWCYQNPVVDQMYRDNNWDRAIEPQGQEDGIRTQGDPAIIVDDVPQEETWEEDGQKKYFRNDLVKELLRSPWYEWDTKCHFLRLKSVKEWRIGCQSKFGTPGPSRSSAQVWRTKEDERVKAWTSGTELPGVKLDFKSPPNVMVMVVEIESAREQAKQMTRREEPTVGRPSKLSPSTHEDLKVEVKKAHALLGFNVMTVQLAAHKLLMSQLQSEDGEDCWMPSDTWVQWSKIRTRCAVPTKCVHVLNVYTCEVERQRVREMAETVSKAETGQRVQVVKPILARTSETVDENLPDEVRDVVRVEARDPQQNPVLVFSITLTPKRVRPPVWIILVLHAELACVRALLVKDLDHSNLPSTLELVCEEQHVNSSCRRT
jgi:hypothetical protein